MKTAARKLTQQVLRMICAPLAVPNFSRPTFGSGQSIREFLQRWARDAWAAVPKWRSLFIGFAGAAGLVLAGRACWSAVTDLMVPGRMIAAPESINIPQATCTTGYRELELAASLFAVLHLQSGHFSMHSPGLFSANGSRTAMNIDGDVVDAGAQLSAPLLDSPLYVVRRTQEERRLTGGGLHRSITVDATHTAMVPASWPATTDVMSVSPDAPDVVAVMQTLAKKHQVTLEVAGVESTLIPWAAGDRAVAGIWELHVTVTGTATPQTLHAYLKELSAGSLTAHVDELDLEWKTEAAAFQAGITLLAAR